MSELQTELEQFKRNVNFVAYAASLGFAVNRKKSWRGSTAMNRGHEKIIITRLPNRRYVYWSPFDEKNSGSIIDFVQREKGLNLGEVRKELRPWL